MTENEKLEIIARAICESYRLDPDTPMTVNDPPTKRWEMYKPQARAASDGMAEIDAKEKNCQRTTLPQPIGKRKIQL